MSAISLRLPDYLHKQIRSLADANGVSINQLITLACAEKTSAMLTEDYLKARAQGGSRERFNKVLRKIKPSPPLAGDEL